MEHKKTLERRRIECGLTQQQVADEIGVQRSTIYRWEAGLSKPKDEHLQALEALFEKYESMEKEPKKEKISIKKILISLTLVALSVLFGFFTGLSLYMNLIDPNSSLHASASGAFTFWISFVEGILLTALSFIAALAVFFRKGK